MYRYCRCPYVVAEIAGGVSLVGLTTISANSNTEGRGNIISSRPQLKLNITLDDTANNLASRAHLQLRSLTHPRNPSKQPLKTALRRACGLLA